MALTEKNVALIHFIVENDSNYRSPISVEKYIKDKIAPNKFHKDNKYYVIVGWDNNRRRNVYERGLKKYGYQYTYDDGYKHLKKRII